MNVLHAPKPGTTRVPTIMAIRIVVCVIFLEDIAEINQQRAILGRSVPDFKQRCDC